MAALAGTLSAIIGSMGLGGGGILIIYFNLFTDVPQSLAQGINLLFFIPTAVIASLFRWKQGSLRLARILPAVIGGCIAASLFTIVSKHVQPEFIRTLFGLLLIVTGIRELFYRPRKAK